MSRQLSRGIVLTTLLAACMLLLVLAVALELDANAETAFYQGLPLAVVCSAAFSLLIADPFAR